MRFFVLLGFFLAATAPLFAQKVTVELVQNHLVTNEVTMLQVIIEGVRPTAEPQVGPVPPLTIRPAGRRTQIINGYRSYGFNYQVSCFKAGTYEIPPVTVISGNRTFQSQPLTLKVYDANETLQPQQGEVSDQTFGYYTALLLEKDSLFVGERSRSLVKLYLPRSFQVAEHTLAELETDNLAAWRFEAQSGAGYLRFGGKEFSSYLYESTVAGLQPGKATLGPGFADVAVRVGASSFGLTRWRNINARVDLPSRELTIKPLPQPIPANFNGAVGIFELSANPQPRAISLGESLNVDLRVIGKGNLDNLPAPRLVVENSADFQTFDAIKNEQGSERRVSEGEVTFSQVVRPARKVDSLPPYELTFFDPDTETFRTVSTAAIPITVTGSAAAVAGAVSQLPPTPLLLTPGPVLTPPSLLVRYPYLWQVLPVSGLLALLGLLFRRKMAERRQLSAPRRELKSRLAQLERAREAGPFYREVCQLLDEHPGATAPPEAAAWREKRDDFNYNPVIDSSADLLPKERSQVLNVLKATLKNALLFCLTLPFFQQLEAQDLEQLWREENYQAGAEHLRQGATTASQFYNLALFEEKLDRPAAAITAYYRALAADPSLDRARLTALINETGALAPNREKPRAWLAIVPEEFFRQLLFLAGWLLVFFVLIRRGFPRYRRWAFAGGVLGLFLLPVALAALYFYPDDPSFRSLKQAAVVQDSTALHASPHQNAKQSRTLLPGSLVYPRTNRGPWTYLTLPGNRKGWIPTKALEPIVPDPKRSE